MHVPIVYECCSDSVYLETNVTIITSGAVPCTVGYISQNDIMNELSQYS